MWNNIMEYYSAVRRNDMLIHALTWKKLENIMPWSEPGTKGQTLCDSTYVTYLQEANSQKTESRSKDNKAWQEGGMGSYHRIATEFGVMKTF